MRISYAFLGLVIFLPSFAAWAQENDYRFGNEYEGRRPDRVFELFAEPETATPRREPERPLVIERYRAPYNPDPELNPNFNFYGGLFDDYRELSDFYAVPGGFRRYDVFGPNSAYKYDPYDDTAYFRSRYFDYYTQDPGPWAARARMLGQRREILTRERVRQPQTDEFRFELRSPNPGR